MSITVIAGIQIENPMGMPKDRKQRLQQSNGLENHKLLLTGRGNPYTVILLHLVNHAGQHH